MPHVLVLPWLIQIMQGCYIAGVILLSRCFVLVAGTIRVLSGVAGTEFGRAVNCSMGLSSMHGEMVSMARWMLCCDIWLCIPITLRVVSVFLLSLSLSSFPSHRAGNWRSWCQALWTGIGIADNRADDV